MGQANRIIVLPITDADLFLWDVSGDRVDHMQLMIKFVSKPWNR